MKVEKTNPGILTITIDKKETLYKAYMPFVEHGGLFIQTKKEYRLGDEVFMLLSLMDDADKLPVAGKVVWVTPQNAQANRKPGIGIQFSEQDRGQARARIETHLAGRLESDEPTHTM